MIAAVSDGIQQRLAVAEHVRHDDQDVPPAGEDQVPGDRQRQARREHPFDDGHRRRRTALIACGYPRTAKGRIRRTAEGGKLAAIREGRLPSIRVG
ncbi:hypothetical protein [Actinoallomurus sp. NPDC052274]|uniref:hypothetical protein n=1 Tax=Actinoallomurus sp. NPDC052274 TaxID=3155420 RepID=UPI0034270034